MKLPKTKELANNTFKSNKKKLKKNSKKAIKLLNKTLRDSSRDGNNRYSYTVKDHQSSAQVFMLMFRWYRRYSGLNVTIKEQILETQKKWRLIEEMHITISW